MTSQPSGELPALPQVVGGYELQSLLGEGGMGVVHLARRPGGERVALKVLRQHIVGDDEARRRLAREVSSLERVRSRWVAEVLDADPWAPVPYVATRYVPGYSLHDLVHHEGPIEGHDLLWFAACLAEGLAAVHEVDVLHRDVKPSNVLMEGRTPILIDFGLARVADDPRLTHTGWLLGTPGYLAPEILYGEEATPAADLHSWAATVAFAGTARSPFGRGPSMAIMDRVRRGEHDLTGLGGPLRDVVAAALEPEPARRPSLEAVLAWLRPQTTRPSPLLAPAPGLTDAPDDRGDPFTLPLALANAGDSAEPTRVEATRVDDEDGREHTRVLPFRQSPPEQWDDVSWAHPAVDQLPPAIYGPPPPDPVPAGERARRGLLLLSGAGAIGAATAAAPWLTAMALVVLVWLLRSGSLAASSVGDRRRLRGRRWYDGVQLLAKTPWHLVRSVPSTALLVLWGGGLAAAGALVCYAGAVDVRRTLVVVGVGLAAGLWWGPGARQVRSPLGRLVRPLSRTAGWWMIAMVVVLAVAGAAAVLVAGSGVDWSPATGPPW